MNAKPLVVHFHKLQTTKWIFIESIMQRTNGMECVDVTTIDLLLVLFIVITIIIVVIFLCVLFKLFDSGVGN